jgi:hypothetical protein
MRKPLLVLLCVAAVWLLLDKVDVMLHPLQKLILGTSDVVLGSVVILVFLGVLIFAMYKLVRHLRRRTA